MKNIHKIVVALLLCVFFAPASLGTAGNVPVCDMGAFELYTRTNNLLWGSHSPFRLGELDLIASASRERPYTLYMAAVTSSSLGIDKGITMVFWCNPVGYVIKICIIADKKDPNAFTYLGNISSAVYFAMGLSPNEVIDLALQSPKNQSYGAIWCTKTNRRIITQNVVYRENDGTSFGVLIITAVSS